MAERTAGETFRGTRFQRNGEWGQSICEVTVLVFRVLRPPRVRAWAHGGGGATARSRSAPHRQPCRSPRRRSVRRRPPCRAGSRPRRPSAGCVARAPSLPPPPLRRSPADPCRCHVPTLKAQEAGSGGGGELHTWPPSRPPARGARPRTILRVAFGRADAPGRQCHGARQTCGAWLRARSPRRARKEILAARTKKRGTTAMRCGGATLHVRVAQRGATAQAGKPCTHGADDCVALC